MCKVERLRLWTVFGSCYFSFYFYFLCFTCSKAIDVIRTHSETSPLFLYLAYQAPHSPFDGQEPPARYFAHYPDELALLARNNTDIGSKHRIQAAAVTALDAGVPTLFKNILSTFYRNPPVLCALYRWAGLCGPSAQRTSTKTPF